jgi:hypothetical protein
LNIQNEPMLDIAYNLEAIILANFPAIRHVKMGWPDRKWIQVEHNLPAVFLVDISEKATRMRPLDEVSSTIDNGDGTGLVVYEQARLHTLVQMSLFTHTKADRDQLGWGLKQHFVTNYRIEIVDYTLATPAATGESLMLFLRGDRKEMAGEANFWQRDLTWEIQARLLNAVDATKVQQVQVGQTTDRSRPVSTGAPTAPTAALNFSTLTVTDAAGTVVDTITITPTP